MTEDQGNELLAQTAWVHGLARSLLARHDLAADVAQETMVVAWRRGLKGVLDVRAFLAQILRRLARRRAHSEVVRHQRELALPPRGPAPATGDVVAKAAMQREVVDAVLRLSEPYRTAVLLRFLEDRSYQEIAVATGAPLETVRTRIKRGLQQLRSDLDRRHGAARAWALPILGVTGFQQAAVAAAGAAGAATVAGASATGVLAMSMQAKVMSAAGVALAGILAWQLWPEAPASVPVVDAGGGAPAMVVAPASPPEATAPTALERTAVTTAGSKPAPAPLLKGPEWTARGRVIEEASHRGIAAAELRFHPSSSARMSDAKQAVTAADGSFEFTFHLQWPGQLAVSHPDYAGTYVPLSELVERSMAAGSTTVLIPDIALVHGEALAGRVLAANGAQPVPNARILHYRARDALATQLFTDAVEVCTADANGRFTLPYRVGPGRLREWLVALSGTAIGWRELLPSRRAGQDHHFDLVMRPVARLRVRALDAGGRPLQGAVAVALPECEPISSQADPGRKQPLQQELPPFLRGTTGADGRIELMPPIGDDALQYGMTVPGGRVLVAVGSEGHRQWQQTIDLKASETRDIDAKLMAGTTIRVTGTVLNRDGSPVGGAEVTADTMRTRTDAGGRFFFRGVDATSGQIGIRAVAKGIGVGNTTVSCNEARAEVAVELRLEPALTVRGIVVDQDGRPIQGAHVSAGPDTQTLTTGDGRFELNGVRVSYVNVESVGRQREFNGTITPIPDPLPEELRITVLRGQGGARIEIALRDRVTGRTLEPVFGWLCPLDQEGRRGLARALELRDGLCHDQYAQPGRYLAHVETRDGRQGEHEFAVPAGVPLVREALLFDPASTVLCSLDVTPVTKLPKQLRIELVPGDFGKLRVRGRASATGAGDMAIVVDPARERELEVIGVRPGTAFHLRIIDDAIAGEVPVITTTGANVAVTLRAEPAGKLQFARSAPASFDMMTVEWQLPDGGFSSVHQLFRCKGKRELGAIAVPAGTVAWRVGYLPAGGEPVRREGRTLVMAGSTAEATID